MKTQIDVITYEQDRLNYFTDLMNKAQERYKRLFKKFKHAPYASEESQALSDAGRETHFLGDVVGILEGKQTEWISVEDRLPPEKMRCLVYSPIDGVNLGHRLDEVGRFYVTKPYPEHPTHWMPLPEPPKMKGGES